MRTLPLLALALAACGGATRTARVVAAPAHVLADTPTGALADVQVVTGQRGDEATAYDPPRVDLDGTTWRRPVAVTSLGAVRLVPKQPDVHWTVWTRTDGPLPADFHPFPVATGVVADRLPVELRPLPDPLPDEGLELPMAWLHDPWRPTPLSDGDLVLLELSDGERTEHYLFRSRQLGWRLRPGAGLLVRVPFPEVTAAPLAPVLALSLSLGHRPRTAAPGWIWLGDHLAVVGSLGIGTTRLPDPTDPLDASLGSVYDAALGGGGLQMYDILSIQILANLTAVARNAQEADLTLAIGFDAVAFAQRTRQAGARLFRSRSLDDAPSYTWRE